MKEDDYYGNTSSHAFFVFAGVFRGSDAACKLASRITAGLLKNATNPFRCRSFSDFVAEIIVAWRRNDNFRPMRRRSCP
jgi:hypothetical protein